MDATRTGAGTAADAKGVGLTPDEAERIALGYVAAYNERDLEAMLALQDENVVSHPSRLFEQESHRGHDGVRAWWRAMVRSDRWYRVAVREIRLLDADRVAVLGDIWQDEELLSPWGVVVRVRGGLIVESHSYLSDDDLLDRLGLIG
jgi:ketosteroid isomerase-like protein